LIELDNQDSYNHLVEAYSEQNLTRITTQLIMLYQEKQFGALREVMAAVGKFTGKREDNIQRCFAYLLKLYHPDKKGFYKNYINDNFKMGKLDRLESLKHIFIVGEMDFGAMRFADIDDDIDYHPQEIWDESESGFTYIDEAYIDQPDNLHENSTEETVYDDFLSAVKRKIYGNMDIDFPVYLLEDLEEIEMAEYEIRSLEGIRFCKFALMMDLSGNQINDLSEIGECKKLKELYLSNNQISIIDALGQLHELAQLDLSHNLVDDLGPLYRLEHLEYINLLGNPAPKKQIEELKKKGIIVVN
jgi:hypothetical protein